MAQPYVGEIRMFGGNFAPAGWMFCDGQLLPISENETLFQLIGTTYGGDGEETFALPDLRGRVPSTRAPGSSSPRPAARGGHADPADPGPHPPVPRGDGERRPRRPRRQRAAAAHVAEHHAVHQRAADRAP